MAELIAKIETSDDSITALDVRLAMHTAVMYALHDFKEILREGVDDSDRKLFEKRIRVLEGTLIKEIGCLTE